MAKRRQELPKADMNRRALRTPDLADPFLLTFGRADGPRGIPMFLQGRALRQKPPERGWPAVTPAAISTDPTAGAPTRSWLKSVELHSSNASPRSHIALLAWRQPSRKHRRGDIAFRVALASN